MTSVTGRKTEVHRGLATWALPCEVGPESFRDQQPLEDEGSPSRGCVPRPVRKCPPSPVPLTDEALSFRVCRLVVCRLMSFGPRSEPECCKDVLDAGPETTRHLQSGRKRFAALLG